MNLVQLSTNVASQAANAALLVHGMPVAGPVTQALPNELLQVQDQQAEPIGRIEGAVNRLVHAPWTTARMYLTEAASLSTPAPPKRACARRAAPTAPRYCVC
jgi:hypothetical protein